MNLLVVGVLGFLLGVLAVRQMPQAEAQQPMPPAPEIKRPKWQYGLTMKARKWHEDRFTDNTQKYGVEVFKDENTGNLIYISESGSIAVVPAK